MVVSPWSVQLRAALYRRVAVSDADQFFVGSDFLFRRRDGLAARANLENAVKSIDGRLAQLGFDGGVGVGVGNGVVGGGGGGVGVGVGGGGVGGGGVGVGGVGGGGGGV